VATICTDAPPKGFPISPDIPPDDVTAPQQPADPGGWVLGNRYRVLGRIGVGGMAEVFRAHDEMLDREVAVKVFRSQAPTPGTEGGPERQETELRVLARLNHPNLITLFDGLLSGSHAYLVMELIDGPSLAARIAQGPVPEAQVREIGSQIADALAYVHAQGMVHRDVKPANILLGADPTIGDMTVRARLSDFGIVRLLDTEHVTRVDLTVGTASYLSPEQARGAEVGPASDVYSLGLTLLEALTGQRAYDGDGQIATMLAHLERPPAIPPSLPAPWPGLLAAMTALDPVARPDALAVAQTLREAATHAIPLAPVAAAVGPPMQEPVVAPMPVGDPTSTPPRPHRSSHLVGILAAAVIVGLLALGGFVLLGGSGNPPANSQPPSTGASGATTAPRSHTATTGPVEAKHTSQTSAPPQTSSSRSTSSSSASTSAGTSSSRPPSSSATTSTRTSTSTSSTGTSSSTATSPAPSSSSTTPAAAGSPPVSGSLANVRNG
jgi:serine/threonine protein kinase